MSSQDILGKLSEHLEPESAFVNEDAFVATLDSMGGIVVLTRQDYENRTAPTRVWWLMLIFEQREQMQEAQEYCEMVERLGFQS